MIPNIKTYFHKKVTFLVLGLVLVPVLQLLIFKNGTKTCAIANLYSSKYYHWKKIKTCKERPYLISGRFMLQRCFIRLPPTQDDLFCMVPRMVVLYRFDCMIIYQHHYEYKIAMRSIDKSCKLPLLKPLIDYYLYFTLRFHILVDYSLYNTTKCW